MSGVPEESNEAAPDPILPKPLRNEVLGSGHWRDLARIDGDSACNRGRKCFLPPRQPALAFASSNKQWILWIDFEVLEDHELIVSLCTTVCSEDHASPAVSLDVDWVGRQVPPGRQREHEHGTSQSL